jgi:hypothetical protein
MRFGVSDSEDDDETVQATRRAEVGTGVGLRELGPLGSEVNEEAEVNGVGVSIGPSTTVDGVELVPWEGSTLDMGGSWVRVGACLFLRGYRTLSFSFVPDGGSLTGS